MAIDPIDTARDEARARDNKRADQKKEAGRLSGQQDFASRLQIKARSKESRELQSREQSREKAQSEGDLMQRVIQAFRAKDQTKGDERRDTSKREESKKEKFQEEGGEARYRSVSQEGHARVAARQGSQEGGSGGGGGAGGGAAGQEGRDHEGSSFGGGKGQGSFQDSGEKRNRHELLSGSSPKGGLAGQKIFSVHKVGKGAADLDRSASGEKRAFLTDPLLDEVVESVRININEQMEKEIEITLSDNYFNGLKIKVSRSPSGVVVTFICPNRSVKELFLFSRPRLYSRLKEKGIAVARIEVNP